MDVGAYLKRIHYAGPVEASLGTLRDLHLAHLYAVPFENLDIHLGRPIRLDRDALFDKIVSRQRGGFCYELNGLFAALLTELGCRVTLLSSEVARQSGGFSPPFDHLTLQVDLDEPWLADVGFGEGFRLPLRLNDFDAQAEGDGTCCFVADGEYRILMRRESGGDWTPQYRFTLEPHSLEDFADRCRFHQTSPESHFTQNRICTLARPDGRVTLSGMRLITTTPGGKTERMLVAEAEYAAILREQFGVLE